MKERMIKTRTKITTLEEVTDTRHNQNEGSSPTTPISSERSRRRRSRR